MLRPLLLTATLTLPVLFPTFGQAAGGNDHGVPQTTQTTRDCFQVRQWDPDIKKYVRFEQKVNGVWDPKIQKCVRPDKTSHLDIDMMYRAVRELAYANRLSEVTQILDQMPDQMDDLVLTYRGFTARKLGHLAQADVYYEQAIAQNPDNTLARSYMGQGKVVAGDMVAAVTQLREIQNRGGAGTWPETSLRSAIETGETYNY